MIEAYFKGHKNGAAASYSVVILLDRETLWDESKQVQGTCNAAGYAGLLSALHWLVERGLNHDHILVRGDSQFIIQQCFGKWKIREGSYTALAREAKGLLGQFSNIQGEWISAATLETRLKPEESLCGAEGLS